MDEKKMIPLFDPNDRGGNSKSHLNPQIYHVVIGKDIDHLALMALMRKQITKGVMLPDQPIVVSEPIYTKMVQYLGEAAPISDERFIERGQKRGAFDRTGDSPAKTLKKKQKWWER